jgi:hypothetical protein
LEENYFRDIPIHRLESKLGFIGIDQHMAQRDNLVFKMFQTFGKVSKSIASMMPFQFTKSNSRVLTSPAKVVGAANLPRHFDARE